MRPPAGSPEAAPPVLVVMAVFAPDPGHLSAQIDSIAAQKGARPELIAVIADRLSAPLVTRAAEAAGLPCHIVTPDTELDAVRAFETGLGTALGLSEGEAYAGNDSFIALSDQDDIWHVDRLARGIARLTAQPRALLVHSDANLVDAGGRPLPGKGMFATEKRVKHPGLRGLLYRNTITGMTALMRARLLRSALPFPAQSGVHYYHDLWLGLVAHGLAGKDGVALIDAPLVDYRQHGGNAIGAVNRRGGALAGLRARLGRLPDAMWLRREAASYALARYLALSLHRRLLAEAAVGQGNLDKPASQTAKGVDQVNVQALDQRGGADKPQESQVPGRVQDGLDMKAGQPVLDGDRAVGPVGGPGLDAPASGKAGQGPDNSLSTSRPLRPFLRGIGTGRHLADAAGLALGGHFGPARIAAGFAVVSAGRMVWALRAALGTGLAEALHRFDSRLYSLSPGAEPTAPAHEDSPAGRRAVTADSLIDRRKTALFHPDFTGGEATGPALTLLVPTLNPTEIFAGIATAIDIGLGLAARGARLRLIATDLPLTSPGASRAFVLGRMDAAGRAAGAADRITLHDGQKGGALPMHRGDVLMATAWWTAHVARGLIDRHGMTRQRFLYLLQDYEPGFYAWGPEYADAEASYRLDFDPLFNTTLLRDDFAARGFAFAKTAGTLAFRPAIDIARYAAPPRPPRAPGTPRRLALYGRPEVARNMFPTAIEALTLFAEARQLTPAELEPVSIGMAHAPVRLPGGLRLKSLGKLPLEDYPAYLRGTDIGLSLMYSPHPSHPPLEMAASGMRVVTNHFGPKDLSRLGPAILSTAPTGPALAEALSRAWDMPPVSAGERRIDLAPLGLPMTALLDALASRLAPDLGCAPPPKSEPVSP